ncbi:MAG: hypothetical protein WAK48_25410 [Candidatus Acidiferrum sp.]|jgi:hypothetical protein
MAVHAQLVPWFSQLRIVVRAMHIVATETGHAVAVHDALYKIISLHTVLVRGAIREMSESRFAQVVCFQLPKITQILTDAVSNWPIVVLAFDGIR